MNKIAERIIKIAKVVEANSQMLGAYTGMLRYMPTDYSVSGAIQPMVKNGIDKLDNSIKNFEKGAFDWSDSQIHKMLVYLETVIAWINQCIRITGQDSTTGECLKKAKFVAETYHKELTEFGQNKYDKNKKQI